MKQGHETTERDRTQRCQVFSASHCLLLHVEHVLKGKYLDLCAHMNIHVCGLVHARNSRRMCVHVQIASGWMDVYIYVCGRRIPAYVATVEIPVE